MMLYTNGIWSEVQKYTEYCVLTVQLNWIEIYSLSYVILRMIKNCRFLLHKFSYVFSQTGLYPINGWDDKSLNRCGDFSQDYCVVRNGIFVLLPAVEFTGDYDI